MQPATIPYKLPQNAPFESIPNSLRNPTVEPIFYQEMTKKDFIEKGPSLPPFTGALIESTDIRLPSWKPVFWSF